MYWLFTYLFVIALNSVIKDFQSKMLQNKNPEPRYWFHSRIGGLTNETQI